MLGIVEVRIEDGIIRAWSEGAVTEIHIKKDYGNSLGEILDVGNSTIARPA